MHRLLGPSSLVLLPALALWTVASTTRAQLSLTQPAMSRGFTLQPFVLNAPSVTMVGPLGFALRTDGQVLVTTVAGEIRRFPSHANNQDWSGGTLVSSRGLNNAHSIAQIQVNNVWRYYLAENGHGRILEIDENGHDAVPAHVLSLPGVLCLVPYPPAIVNAHTGHLFATRQNSSSIFEVDPIANTITTFVLDAGFSPDGLSFGPDGSILYVAAYASLVVKGFDVSTQGLVFTSPVTSPASHPDGIAIGTGILNGYIYANCGEGVVWEFGLPNSPHAGEVNLIAEGGSRGDFIGSDPDVFCGFAGHPSLLLTQSDRMLRLDPPGGGFFGPPCSSTDLVDCTAAAGTVTSYNGDGMDEDLLSASPVVMSSPWTATVTSVNPHGPGGPIVLTVRASLHNGPTFSSPVGGRLNESLIAGPVFAKYLGTHNGITGTIVTPAVPISCSLLGVPWAAQATLVGGGFGDLTNAVSGVVGNL